MTAALTEEIPEFEGDGSYREFSSELQAVVASGAVGDMAHESHVDRAVFAYRNLVTGGDRNFPEDEKARQLKRASPASYVSGEVPPIQLIHGAKDEIVKIDSTDDFVAAMKKAGAEIDYLRFADVGHAVMGQEARKTNPALLTFFETHLGSAPKNKDGASDQ